MRIHHTKQFIAAIPNRLEDISIDLDAIAAARPYEDSKTQVVTNFGLMYILIDTYNNFKDIWEYQSPARRAIMD